MNAHIQHLHYSAQLAELRGFHYFARAIKREMVKALLASPSHEFWRFVLSLPHKVDSVSVFIDGEEVTVREYLAKKFPDLLAEPEVFAENKYLADLPKCAVCGGDSSHIVLYGFNCAGKARPHVCLPPDPMDKVTAPYTMFGKHSSNPKIIDPGFKYGDDVKIGFFPDPHPAQKGNHGDERTDLPLFPAVEPGGVIRLHPANYYTGMREIYERAGYIVLPEEA